MTSDLTESERRDLAEQIDSALSAVDEAMARLDADDTATAVQVAGSMVTALDGYLFVRSTSESYLAEHLERIAVAIESEPDASERFPAWGLALRYLQQRARRDFESSTDQPYPFPDFPEE